jgi:uncharacterized protein (DUF983 family)
MKEKKKNLVLRMMTEKCPNCGQGAIFEKRKRVFQFPEMKDRCEHCGYLYNREPGYFLGAMYISYGLAVFQGLLAFLACYFFFPQLPTLAVCFIILGTILLFSIRNFRISRVVYMYIFPQ